MLAHMLNPRPPLPGPTALASALCRALWLGRPEQVPSPESAKAEVAASEMPRLIAPEISQLCIFIGSPSVFRDRSPRLATRPSGSRDLLIIINARQPTRA